jgi:hypothetical protein
MTFHLGFVPVLKWIYLPAGVCIVSTLLFGWTGAAGIFAARLLLNLIGTHSHLAFAEILDACIGAIAEAAGPFLMYLVADQVYGIRLSLDSLTAKRLFILATFCSATCSGLQSLWMTIPFRDIHTFLMMYAGMFMGELSGTLIVFYFGKIVLYKR